MAESSVNAKRLSRAMALMGSVAGMVATFAPGTALAQSGTAAASTPEPAIADIIVTARRTQEKLQSTPVAVSAIPATTLARAQINDVTAIQYLAPSLVITPNSGNGQSASIGIRGQVQSDALVTLDPAVGLYLDGVYLARSPGAILNLVDIDRVEVLRGPQGTLFGRNTTGGAVTLYAKEPEDKLTGSARLRYGNYNIFEATGIINVPLNDTLAVRLAYQHSQHDGYTRNLYTGGADDADNTEFVRGSIKYDGHQGLTSTFSVDYTDRRTAGIGSRLIYVGQDSVARFVAATCAAAPASCGFTTPVGTIDSYVNPKDFHSDYNGVDGFATLRVLGLLNNTSIDLNDNVTLKFITAYRQMRNANRGDTDGTPFTILYSGPADPNMVNVKLRQHQFSEEAQLSGKSLDGRLNWIAGGFYFHEKGDENVVGPTLFPLNPFYSLFHSIATNDSSAVYGQVTYKITDTVRFTGGLRYTWDTRQLTNQNGNQDGFTGDVTCALDPALIPSGECSAKFRKTYRYLSYEATVDWQAAPNAFFYAKTSRASRAGGFNGRVSRPAALAAQPFSPERVTNYEIGAKLDLLNRHLRINGSVFYAKQDNIQSQLIANIDGQLTSFVRNVAKAHLTGGEVEVVARPFNRLTLSGSLAIVEPKYDQFIDPFTGEDLRNSPFGHVTKTTGSASVEYELPLPSGGVTAHADFSYRGPTYFGTAPETRNPGYGLLNATLTWHVGDTGMELGVFGRNLTNKNYYPGLFETMQTPIKTVVGFPGDPRTYGVSASYRF